MVAADRVVGTTHDFQGAPGALGKPAPTPDIRRLDHFPQGVPDTIRRALLTIGKHSDMGDQAPALMLLELWNRGRCDESFAEVESFALPDLVDYAERIGWNTTRDTLDKGIQQALALGLLRSSEGGIERYGEGARGGEKTSKKPTGRPSKRYTMRRVADWVRSFLTIRRKRAFEFLHRNVRALAEPAMWAGNPATLATWKAQSVNRVDQQSPTYEKLLKERQRARARYDEKIAESEKRFRLDELFRAPSLPLLAEKYPNQIAYRDLYRRATVTAYPGRQITIRKAAEEIGRSVPALRSTDRRIGIKREPQFELHPIDPRLDLGGQIRGMTKNAVIRADGSTYHGARLVTDQGETYSIVADEPGELETALAKASQWVSDKTAAGRSISLRVQKASREFVTELPTQPDVNTQTPADEAPMTTESTSALTQADQSARPERAAKRRPANDSGWNLSEYSRAYVERQLAMRGLRDHPEGLIVLATGELIRPETHPTPGQFD